MKKIYLLSLLIMGIIVSCQNEESLLENQQSKACMTITASLGDISDSRTTMETDGNGYKVVWSETDTLSVFVGSSTAHNKFKITKGVGETSATFVSVGEFSFGSNIEGSNSFANVGIYPYSSNTTVTKSNDDYVISTTIPTNQTYAENSFGENASPMIGVSNGFNFSFKNVASALAIPLKGTQTITHATLESSANKIAGSVKITAVANNNWIPTTDMSNGSSKVILSCGEGVELNESTATNFFFVLAPGTYTAGDLTIKFYDNAGNYYAIHYTTKDQTFTRSIAKVFNERTFEVSGQAGIEEANNALANGNEDVTVTIAESDNTPTLELPETDSENPTNLTFDNTIPEDKTITIKASTESDNKEAKEVNLSVPQGTNGNFDIQLPNSTVSLNATNGTATYNNVIAETAENTLIVGQDVTIKNLTVKKGNVRVHGKIEKIERHENNQGIVTIIVEEGASIPEDLNNTQVFNIITSKKVTTAEELNEAIAANSNIIVLGADITSSEIITINESITLDGNGYTLTSTAGRAINVSGADGVTIKNLTINASGERAINIIQSATNVTIDHVTATAANYTVNVAGSAPEAVVNITNSDLTGLNVINIAASEAQIKVDQTKITCNDQTDVEDYGAITLHSDATNANVVATNVTFDIKGNSKQVSNGATGATVSINGANVPQNAVAKIEYGAYYYSFETLEGAISKAKSGETVKLIADVTTSSIIVVDKAITLDGNGYALTSTAGRAINVSGADGVTIKNLTINASGERAINIIQNATNVTIDNVTATAANYTVNVASSAPSAKVEIKNSTLTGLCTVNVSAASADVKVDNSTIHCNDNNTTAGESYSALSLNKEAVGGKIVATRTTINVVEGSDSSKGRNGAENGEVTIDGSTADVVVMVACITYPGSNYYHAFATLAKAVEFAKNGDVISLLRDIEISEPIVVNKTITIDLNGKTVTANCQKAFEIYADVTIKNGTIISQQRCVDTRTNVNLTLTDVTLKADTYYSVHGNQQALTIGGSNHGTKVSMTNVTINAGYQGYAIISFVKTELTATNSNLNGYAALYVKEGSDGSQFNFNGSTLSGTTGSNDVAGNSFATIAIEANNVNVTLDANSNLNSIGNHHTKFYIKEGTGSTVTGPNVE